MSTSRLAVSPEQTERNNALLNHAAACLRVFNDATLCRALGVPAPVVSKIRNGHLAIGPTMLIRLHERVGISFPELRQYVPA